MARDLQENHFISVLGAMIAVVGLGQLVVTAGAAATAYAALLGDRAAAADLPAVLLVAGVWGLLLWGLIRFARFVQRRGVIRRPGSAP